MYMQALDRSLAPLMCSTAVSITPRCTVQLLLVKLTRQFLLKALESVAAAAVTRQAQSRVHAHSYGTLMSVKHTVHVPHSHWQLYYQTHIQQATSQR